MTAANLCLLATLVLFPPDSQLRFEQASASRRFTPARREQPLRHRSNRDPSLSRDPFPVWVTVGRTPVSSTSSPDPSRLFSIPHALGSCWEETGAHWSRPWAALGNPRAGHGVHGVIVRVGFRRTCVGFVTAQAGPHNNKNAPACIRLRTGTAAHTVAHSQVSRGMSGYL